jgi:putative phosphoesterase
MRLGVIADIHGNAPGLKAVCDTLNQDENGIDAIVCLGDIVGVLGSPNECVSLTRQHADYSVYGNHDSRVFDNRTFLPQRDLDIFEYKLITERLSTTNQRWLQELPRISKINEKILFAHCRPTAARATGTGRDPGVYPRSLSEIADTIANEIEIVLLGHTHHQHSESMKSNGGETLVCNPGAVGFPVQTDNDDYTGIASYAIVDTTTKESLHRSVRYDTKSVIDFLKANGSPLELTTKK